MKTENLATVSVPVPDPISGIQPIPLRVTAQNADAQVKAELARLRVATINTILSSRELAREARKSTSSPTMKAVRPEEPLPPGEVTERFEAIRANVR